MCKRQALRWLIETYKPNQQTLKTKKQIQKIGLRPKTVYEIYSIKNELDRLIAIEFALLALHENG